jgi:RNA recognition motif-containing protein
MNIFVGNLSFAATEDGVKKLFAGFGNISSVTILMRKEKKVPKSRGFGFVQMPVEQEALAAIAALNGKEFMGRVLRVEPARPKKEAQAENEPEEKRERKKPWYGPVFQKPGRYRSGRRTHSYMKRQRQAGLPEEPKPRKSIYDNPLRWRKKKPWQKKQGEHKPWQKTEGEHKPWRKSEGGVKPWQKKQGEHKPWKKAEGEARPWKKPAGEFKPWRKSEGRPQKSRFKGRRRSALPR